MSIGQRNKNPLFTWSIFFFVKEKKYRLILFFVENDCD